MVTAISSGNAPQLFDQAAQPVASKATATPSATAAPAQSSGTDTVQLSSAKAIVQETSETPAQTAKEANAGDPQAKRLLAKETHR